MRDLRAGVAISRRYRNRRIGEFLKELGLAEGRSTGVPKILRAMRENGSPAPVLKSDKDARGFLFACRCLKRLVKRRPGKIPTK